MMKKIIGLFVCTLLIITCVIPVIGEFIALKNDFKHLQKDVTDINPLTSDTTRLKFIIAGNKTRVLRTYWLHIPPSYDGSEAVPLVIVLHGAGAGLSKTNTIYWLKAALHFFCSSGIEKYTEFSKKADEEGFIVVYPNAKFDFYAFHFEYNYGFVPGKTPKCVDDVGFLRALIEKMAKDYLINSSRIYVAGISDGGVMTYSAGAYLSYIVAAIAPVAGTIGGSYSHENQNFYQIPPPAYPVSVIAFHGTSDSLAPYEGGGYYNDSSVNESIAFWVEHNGCNPTPDINISESGKIIRRTYTDGENGTEVILYTTVGGDHWWPGNHFTSGPSRSIDTIQEISATDLIWEFFESHPKQ
jgi:polyhydroxybutyrate depolymerase